jgi:hypothetical protein
VDTATTRDPATIEESLQRLGLLSGQLRRHGFRANLVAVVDRVPYLEVQNANEASGRLQEAIYAAPHGNSWCYWWSWAEPVMESDEAAAAADRIVRVLRARA